MSDIGMGYGEMQVANLCKGYGIGPLHKEVIKDCSFTLEKSKLTVLIGPSGCGKSALINMLAGYETPDAGSILIDGEKVSGPGTRPSGRVSGDRAVPVDDRVRKRQLRPPRARRAERQGS